VSAFIGKLWGKIVQEIESRLAGWLVGALIAVAGSLALVLARPRTWLLTTHTINVPGWSLLLGLLLPVASICVLGYLGIASRVYRLWTYEDQTDVRILLLKWIGNHRPKVVETECIWRYDVVEHELEVKPGSIRKCFSAVAKQTGLRIIEEGQTTVRVRFEPSRRHQRPGDREPPTRLT
jgi:hypothetical protein